MIEADIAAAPRADFFTLAAQRLNYIAQRQQIVAQNIANADTPAYTARDLPPFARFLADVPAAPARTDPAHLAGTLPAIARTTPLPPERAPDGNAVNVETELTKVADGEQQQALVGNLWKSTMNLYLAALGRAG